MHAAPVFSPRSRQAFFSSLGSAAGAIPSPLTTALGSLLVLVLGLAPAADGVTLSRGPYLQRVTSSSALVVWRTATAAACTLSYGPQGTFGTSVVTPSSTQHVATLGGLTPNTRYDYRIRSGSLLAGGNGYYLETAPLPGSGATQKFLVWGDSGKGDAAQMAVAAVMNNETADFGLHVGDIIYPSGEAANYDPRYFQVYAPLIRRTPIWSTIGNHDTGDTQAYLDAWYLPTNTLDGSELFYSFDYGDIHIVCLNSNATFSNTVLNWLRNDLTGTTRRWKMVFFHHTMYSCGSAHGSSSYLISTLGPIFDAAHVDLVLYGHDHDYERTNPLFANAVVGASMNPNYVNPGGTIYVISGGGADPRSVSTSCFFTARALAVSHYCRYVVTGDQLTLEAVDTSGRTLDRMTLSKSGSPPPPPPPPPPPAPTLDLVAPNGGESYPLGGLLQFRWTSSLGVGPIKVELSRSGSTGPWVALFASTANDGEESWSVTGATSDACWARISEASDGSPLDQSQAAFRIVSAPEPPPGGGTTFARINFQPATAAVPSGWTPDAGAVYDAGRGFGWTRLMSMQERLLLPGDPRDTFVDLVNNQAVGVWEIAVPNGQYRVDLSCGDPYTSATHRVTLEGQTAVADVYTVGGKFVQVTGFPVTVADGRLTMTIGGIGNLTHTKVNSVQIASTAIGAPSVSIVVPASNSTIPNAQTSFAFSGTAVDASGAVALVEYRVQGGSWVPASGTTSWSFTATGLAVGANVVEVRARDDAGLYSAVASRTITREALQAVAPPVHEETQTGSTSDADVVASAELRGASGNLYLAAVSTRPAMSLHYVLGLGLTWHLVRSQCSGRDVTQVSLWMAVGTPSGDGAVEAHLAGVCDNAVIAVSRYSNVDISAPIVGIVSGNSNGPNGVCTGGTDGAVYNLPLSASLGQVVAHAAVAINDRTHTPGSGFVELAESFDGNRRLRAGLAVESRAVPNPSTVAVNGALNRATDWALVAVTIRPSASQVLSNPTFVSEVVPSLLTLHPNEPNPFNPTTRIRYELPSPTHVRLQIHDVAGRLVAQLVDADQSAGSHVETWNGRGSSGQPLASGLYICRLQAAGQSKSIKLILVR